MDTMKELHQKLLKYTDRKSFDIEIDYISDPGLESKILSIDKLSHGEVHTRIHHGNNPLQPGDWFYRTYIRLTVIGEPDGRWSTRGVSVSVKLSVTGDSLDNYHTSLQELSDQLENRGELYHRIIEAVKVNLSEYTRSSLTYRLSGEDKPNQNEPPIE